MTGRFVFDVDRRTLYVDGVSYPAYDPWASRRAEMEAARAVVREETFLEILKYDSVGASVRFENGWLISVQWGTGVQGSNRRPLRITGKPPPEFIHEPELVEVAVSCAKGRDFNAFDSGEHFPGMVSTERFNKIAAHVAILRSDDLDAVIPAFEPDAGSL